MSRETRVQSQVGSYQRLKKWYLIPPCLTLSIIRYGSRVKWSNLGKGVAPIPTPQCGSYWKGSLRFTVDNGFLKSFEGFIGNYIKFIKIEINVDSFLFYKKSLWRNSFFVQRSILSVLFVSFFTTKKSLVLLRMNSLWQLIATLATRWLFKVSTKHSFY